MKLHEAQKIAVKYFNLLAPCCQQIMIAGSVRRGKPECKDIELVVIPDKYHLEFLLRKMSEDCQIVIKKNGPKYKQIELPELVNLDLFICDYTTYGCNTLIRTGSADYAHKFMIDIRRRGFFCKNARLYKMRFVDDEEGELVPTPSEESVFEAVGIPMLPPQKRA